MKNITITLDDQTAAIARLQAARDGKSVSRWIGDLLRQRLAESNEYEAAMRSHFARRPYSSEPGTRYPKRDELHDRPGIR